MTLGPTIAQRDQIENARIALHTFFLETLDGTSADELEQLAIDVPSSTAIEEYDWVGDIPGLVEWLGDREEATVMVGSFQIRNKDWASGVRIHKNEILDHKWAQLEMKIRGLAQEARYHYGDLLAKLMINGFDGAAYPDVGTGLGYDGAFFFSDAHSSEGGPSQSNLLTAALSETALESAIKKFGALRNHKGTRPIRVRPTHLIVGPDLEPTADRLLSADIVPGSGNTSVTNIHKGRLKKIVSPWLSGDYHNYWFVGDLTKPLKPLIKQVRDPITSTALSDWSSERMYSRGEQRFGAQSRDNVGYGAWQTLVGSQVAA
jgi:phage major head subunit gpT-like protein